MAFAAVIWLSPAPLVFELLITAVVLVSVIPVVARSPWRVQVCHEELVLTFLFSMRRPRRCVDPEVLRTDSGRLLVEAGLLWEGLIGPTVLAGSLMQRAGPHREPREVEESLASHDVRIRSIPHVEWWAW